jgi:hypothetical protein
MSSVISIVLALAGVLDEDPSVACVGVDVVAGAGVVAVVGAEAGDAGASTRGSSRSEQPPIAMHCTSTAAARMEEVFERRPRDARSMKANS